MRFIEKLRINEPASLVLHKRTPNHNYGNYNDKDTLRLKLLQEQGYLCCYCMRRIQIPKEDKMKIEHFRAFSIYNGTDGYPDLTLDYMNLLGSCKGSEHTGKSEKYHCDKTKANLECPICPTNSLDMESIRFYSDGFIKYTNDVTLNEKIEKVLHLNRSDLKEERKRIWKAAEDYLKKKNTKADINRLLKKYANPVDGKLEPFCQVSVYYLSKKLWALG